MPSSELPLDVPACTCSLSVTLYRNKLVIDSWGECYERKSWSGNDRMRDGCHQCLGLYLILANTLNLQHLMGQELKRSRLCFKIFALFQNHLKKHLEKTDEGEEGDLKFLPRSSTTVTYIETDETAHIYEINHSALNSCIEMASKMPLWDSLYAAKQIIWELHNLYLLISAEKWAADILLLTEIAAPWWKAAAAV